MDVTRTQDLPVLFEEILPRRPLVLVRLQKVRADLCSLLIAGGVVSAAIRLALLG